MPYHKKKKTDRPPRRLVSKDIMKSAVEVVLKGRGIKTVAKEFKENRINISVMTLN